MAYLALALLGPFQAVLDGRPAEGLTSARLRALLAYLAVESHREHTREAVAALLWPERPDWEALSALRYALSNLRGVLGDRSVPSDRQMPEPCLLVTRTSLQFNAASDHWLDVAEFQHLCGHPDVPSLERAVSLYRGPFLHGLSVGDSPAFDEWMLFQGEEYRREVLLALGNLASLQMAEGKHHQAAGWARRQLELEPYREQAHRQLMAALALGGERSTALTHYEACRRMLLEGLGCEPEDETQALCVHIRNGALPPPEPPFRVAGCPSPPVSVGDPPRARFVAREQELAQLGVLLDRALADQGGVVLVTGEEGGGKTALLDEFARRAAESHGELIVLRGRCNAHGGVGDSYLPFREILQTLAGDVEGKRAGGSLSVDQARRAWEALPTVGAALVELGPDLIDTFVPGEALLRRIEGFPALSLANGPNPRRAGGWQVRLRELVRRAGQEAEPGDGPGPAPPDPQADLLAQVTQVLHTVSRRNPLLLVVDDLQWADGGTAGLLFHLGRHLAGSRILLACACRPEALGLRSGAGNPKGDVGTVVHQLCREWGDVLIDLDKTDGRAFVEAYVDSEPNCLGAAFRQALYDHTGGNPLFTVELLRGFEHTGVLVQDEAGRWVAGPGLDWNHWPPQIETLIAGCLAGLPDKDRALLQAASVQGDLFAAEVVARILDRDEEGVVRRLSGPLRTRHRLVEAVSLDRLPSSGRRLSRYRFRHWLLQRTAYRGLDAVARARLHEATGRALAALYATEGEQPLVPASELARHFEAAGMPQEAARYRLEAGRWAAKLAAYEEAIAHLERGLALLEGMPASHERLRLEFRLCMAMCTPVMLQRGWQALASTRALERVSDLAQHPDLQDDPERLTALSVLALQTGWSADPERTRRVGEQLLGLVPTVASGQARDDGRPTLMLGHWALGLSHWLQGYVGAAGEHLGQALALYDPAAICAHGAPVGADPGVMAHAVSGAVQWLAGYPDQARARFRQGVEQAQALGQPSSLAFAHFVAAMITSVVGRDVAAAMRHCQALQSLGQLSLVYGVWAELLAVLAEAQDGLGRAGAPDAGLEQDVTRAVEAISAWRAAGCGAGFAGLLVLQAELLILADQPELGLRAMDDAEAWIERTGMRALAADVQRMRGDLLLTADKTARPGSSVGSPADAEAEACFRRALELAREQGARWLELRAAVRLARLWRAQGRRDAARELLTGIYGFFTEGFDAVDLVEAKALLEEL